MIAAILAGLARYKLAAEVLAFAALAAAGIYGAHLVLDHAREAGRAEVRAEWDRQAIKDKDAAAAITEAWRGARDTAVTGGVKREETIRTLAAGNAAAVDGLRDAVAKIDRAVPDYSADALRALAGTYGELLESCHRERGEGAAEAERLNSEKRTLIEAWPRPANVSIARD